ncbi:Odorant receptor [Nesidiocoris tenuis]|uniref:Odorant receptor n=1 Tax=Nesidiocoris tenuis TaxID=355587 RepID=A0ABN7B180_9HEMI|nr:Odorant receptor [Nesidiocoris tenuis]
MAPNVDVFKAAFLTLSACGINRHAGSKSWTSTAVKVLMLSLSIFNKIVMLMGILQPNVNLGIRLENVAILLAGVPTDYAILIFMFQEESILQFIGRINNLVAEVEEEFGIGVTQQWSKHSSLILIAYSAVIGGGAIPVYGMALYNYHFLGDQGAAPYELYLPFDRNISVYANCAFQASAFVAPVLAVLMNRTVFGTIAIITSGIIKKTRCQFEKVSSSNHEKMLKQAIRWHSQITLIVMKSNSLLGTVFVTEYLAATGYLCAEAYLLATCDPNDNALYTKYLIILFAFISLPLFSCVCGHVISSENDKLYDAIYQNTWYEIPPKSMKNLLVPTIVASQGLEWHYKKLVVFNMATYLQIIRQSYSFFTLMIVVGEK